MLDEASNAKLNGRTTHAIVLVVPPVLSSIAILERYYRNRSVGLPSRWTPTSAHENTVRNLASTVRLIAGSTLIDRFTVIDRNGVVLFDDTSGRRKDGWPKTWDHFVLCPDRKKRAYLPVEIGMGWRHALEMPS